MNTLAIASEKIVKGLARIVFLHSNPAIVWQPPIPIAARPSHRWDIWPDGA
jgi:hypothetical protein